MQIRPFFWKDNQLFVLDQKRLPHHHVFLRCQTVSDVVAAIKSMAVRGAPAIGCCAAYGLALAAKQRTSRDWLERSADTLKSSRPTAVNLAWAVDRLLRVSRLTTANDIFQACVREANQIAREDVENNQRMGQYGAALFRRKTAFLTHCNAGALATAGYGTALGVIRAVHQRRNIKNVFVDETRPYLQGARLTAWELAQEKIPHVLITDNMAGYFMGRGDIDAVIVGCDRVAANGDAANKIGTYSLAILANYHRIPFYVAMPYSTFDVQLPSGRDIIIEERAEDEVLVMNGKRISSRRTEARHPAFDVTPAALITAFITERGIVKPPFRKNLSKLTNKKYGLFKNS